MCRLRERRRGDGGGGDRAGARFCLSLCPSVASSPRLFWGGEINLRFYPNQRGLPRKAIPSPPISTSPLKNAYTIKNAYFLAYFKKLIYARGMRDGELGKSTIPHFPTTHSSFIGAILRGDLES